MKILFFSLNARYIHVTPAPYALGAGVLAFSKEKHEMVFLDKTINDKKETLLSLLDESDAALFAFPVYIWNLPLVRSLLPYVKQKHPEARIVLGGPEVAYDAAHFFSELSDVDFILSGEGERPFALLADTLAKGGDVGKVPGCSYRQADGSLFIAQPFVDTGTPPTPISAGYDRALDGRIAYIEASRGCPFRCAFCLSGRVGGVRFFDLARVKKDILTLANCGAKTVKFVDRTFNADRKRAKEIWSFLLAEKGKRVPHGVCFHFEIAGELLDAEALSLLRAVPRGYFQMEIGLQSLNSDTLRAISRSVRTDLLCENIRALLALGNIHTHIDLIAGLPKEDISSFEKSFNGAFALRPHMLQLGVLKLLRGAPMRERGADYPCVFSQNPPYTVLSTPYLSESDLSVIALAEEGCERLYNSRRYIKTLSLVLETGALTPFKLFCEIGKALQALPKGYTQSQEITLIFEFFSHCVSADALKDAMKEDYAASGASCPIPSVLRDESIVYKRKIKEIGKAYPGEKGVRRSVMLLSTGEVLLTEYKEKDPITGRYPSLKI